MSEVQTQAKAPKASNAKGQQRNDARRYAGEKCTVVSKLEMALQCQLQKPVTVTKRDRSTTWEETEYRRYGPIVIIAGTAFPNGNTEGMERPDMASGFAMTHGVDREFFEEWMSQNEGHPAVMAGLIYCSPKVDDAKAYAKEHKALDSGLGPVKHSKNAQGEDEIVDRRIGKRVSSAEARRAINEAISAE